MWWKGLIICYQNIIRVNYSRKITSKYLLCRTTWEYCHIYVRVAAFWQRVFQTLLNLHVRTGVTLWLTLMISSTENAKDLIMLHEKFQICILKINNIIWRCKKSPITFGQGCTCYRLLLRSCLTICVKDTLERKRMGHHNVYQFTRRRIIIKGCIRSHKYIWATYWVILKPICIYMCIYTYIHTYTQTQRHVNVQFEPQNSRYSNMSNHNKEMRTVGFV